jgi:predicted DNA-binding transcriptional regulator AlpA
MSTQETEDHFAVKKVAWRVEEWRHALGLSRPYVQKMMNEGIVKSVKIGGARLITEAPEIFLERCGELT